MEESTDPGDLLRIRLYRSIISAVLDEASGQESAMAAVEVLQAFAMSLSSRHFELFSGVWSVESTLMRLGEQATRMVG